MPIRFKCPSCRKLLGIARRKAGTVVKCPDCATDLIVPTEVTATVPPSRGPVRRVRAGNGVAAKPPESLPLFERPDFESLLNPAVKQAVVETPPAGPVPVSVKEVGRPAAKPVSVEAEYYDLEPAGLVVSKANLTAVAVVVVVLIGLAFAAGYLLAAARLPTG